jgi:hypothetical protein
MLRAAEASQHAARTGVDHANESVGEWWPRRPANTPRPPRFYCCGPFLKTHWWLDFQSSPIILGCAREECLLPRRPGTHFSDWRWLWGISNESTGEGVAGIRSQSFDLGHYARMSMDVVCSEVRAYPTYLIDLA